MDEGSCRGGEVKFYVGFWDYLECSLSVGYEFSMNGGLIFVYVVDGCIVWGMVVVKFFIFVCGVDDFFVNCVGKVCFEEFVIEVMDEFLCEVLSGFVGNVGEVEMVINWFCESV